MSLGLIPKRSFHGQADIRLPNIGVHVLTLYAWLRALLDIASRDPADHDGRSYDVGRALIGFRAMGI